MKRIRCRFAGPNLRPEWPPRSEIKYGKLHTRLREKALSDQFVRLCFSYFFCPIYRRIRISLKVDGQGFCAVRRSLLGICQNSFELFWKPLGRFREIRRCAVMSLVWGLSPVRVTFHIGRQSIGGIALAFPSESGRCPRPPVLRRGPDGGARLTHSAEPGLLGDRPMWIYVEVRTSGRRRRAAACGGTHRGHAHRGTLLVARSRRAGVGRSAARGAPGLAGQPVQVNSTACQPVAPSGTTGRRSGVCVLPVRSVARHSTT
ncbi:hypothetical protein A8926_4819 [Saccharopolyspora spinosa]|uniref:Uncharacterized protein n=1 Tax=Saccharopolyspora spinosa TaxID=60894 RepID=A0A2N3Y235_SACSN|nr:hypothetical protein A8926_4819 [Saccharopolyspora spinosa]